jgi:glucokinase
VNNLLFIAFGVVVAKLQILVNPMAAIGLDIGATRIKAVLVENDGTILDQIARPTQPAAWIDRVTNLVEELLPLSGPEIEIGVCAPGLANRAGDSIWNCAGKISGLEGFNWRKHFRWQKPIPVMNDAQAALLGENWIPLTSVLQIHEYERFTVSLRGPWER